MIRLLIVEDSPTARALLVAILSKDHDIQIVGEAANGVEGVEMARKLRPDVITMDIHMPRMDGFEATKEIMITAPTPIVIVTSTRAANEIELSMQALRAGALAILQKPAGPGQPGFDAAAEHLIAEVKNMSQVKVVRHWRPVAKAPTPRTEFAGLATRARAIAIATSTGGPPALHAILTQLPRGFPIPILIVQHISVGFIDGLADWLNKAGDIRVKVAVEGDFLQAGTAYLAPDERHLGASARMTVKLSTAPPIGGFRPSATHLFASVAEAFGSASLAVILTGMGEDGVTGLRAVRQAGGRIIAQDEKSSAVFGMPGVAIAAGLADTVLPLDAIASRLIDWI